MTEMSRDDLVEDLQALLVQVLDDAETTIANLHRQREMEVKTVTLRMQTERYGDQATMRDRLQALGGAIDGLAKTAEGLPKSQREDLAAQIVTLSAQVQQVLAGGPDRPMLLAELEKWIEQREGHAQEKKVRTDQNRIRDFVAYAGNKPVNRYRFSDFRDSPTFWRSPLPT